MSNCGSGGQGRKKCRTSSIARRNYKKAIPDDVAAGLKALQVKDNWRNIFYLGFDWLVIAAAVVASIETNMHPLVYLGAVIIIGSRMRAQMNLVHQASHKKLFRNRTANDWVGKIFASFPLGTSLWLYTCAHCIHHAWLLKEQEAPKPTDPKLIRYKELGLVSPPEDKVRFYASHVFKPLLLLHAVHNIVSALSWKGEPRSETLARVVFWVLLLTVVFTTGLTTEFLLFWIVPFCTSFQVIRYFGEMAEHAGLRPDDPWMATRSWDSSSPVRWLLAPHNDSYHIAHHLFPLIPHYKLRDAHGLLMRVPEYASGHHCDGFFYPRRVDAPSVIQDMRRPQNISNFGLRAFFARDESRNQASVSCSRDIEPPLSDSSSSKA